MKILLLGANGQLGGELRRALLPLGEVIALGRNAHTNPQHFAGDLGELSALEKTVRQISPQAIVNAAAYTTVDKAQEDERNATLINTQAPKVLAQLAHELNAWLVHYSTDYVFDGRKPYPYKEDDRPSPLNFYGLTKWQGDQAVQTYCQNHLIFRTSWLYALDGHNFAKTILRLAKERDALKIADDQIGAPTAAELIADITAHALLKARFQPEVAGLYHCSARGTVSWCDYAKFIIETASYCGFFLRMTSHQITGFPSTKYPTAIKRPLNSRLDCSKLEKTFHLQLPPWQTQVKKLIERLPR